MVYAIVKQNVQDFDAWLAAFRAHAPERRRFGCLDETVFRSVADPNEAVAMTHWPSMEALRAFLAAADMPSALKRAGAVGAPRPEIVGEPVFRAQHEPLPAEQGRI